MLDLSLLKNHPETVKDAIRRKYVAIDFDKVIELDEKRRALIEQIDNFRRHQRRFNSEIKNCPAGEREQRLADMKVISRDLEEKEKEFSRVDSEFWSLWLQVPNIPASDVPEGKFDKDNKPVKEVGEKPSRGFLDKGHEELCRLNDIADIERATKVAGSKFYYLKKSGVMLEMALMRLAMDVAMENGFIPMTPPDLVRGEILYGAAHFPPEDDAYYLPKDKLYLAGTAEVGLAGYHKDEILNNTQLPLRYAGYSACFRREAGSYGKKGSGLYRVHQFHKIELFVLCKPDDSEGEHKKLLKIAEDIMQKLELPYRVVMNCGGDLGLPQYKKYDIEAWLPSMRDYGETHSCSNDTDYQARRLGIKYRKADGKTEYVHTLNNTALASPRIILPLLEIHQQGDGSVKIPEALQKYTGFDKIAKS